MAQDFRPDFTSYTKYNENYPFESVIFPADAPLSNEDLNELQEIQKNKLKRSMGLLLNDGFIGDAYYWYNPDDGNLPEGAVPYFTFIFNGTVVYDSVVYRIDQSIDSTVVLPNSTHIYAIYLKPVVTDVDETTTIGGDTENYIADNEWQVALSHRKSVSWIIETVSVLSETLGMCIYQSEHSEHGVLVGYLYNVAVSSSKDGVLYCDNGFQCEYKGVNYNYIVEGGIGHIKAPGDINSIIKSDSVYDFSCSTYGENRKFKVFDGSTTGACSWLTIAACLSPEEVYPATVQTLESYNENGEYIGYRRYGYLEVYDTRLPLVRNIRWGPWQPLHDGVIINSSTEDSTKRFKITVDDSGTISTQEI